MSDKREENNTGVLPMFQKISQQRNRKATSYDFTTSQGMPNSKQIQPTPIGAANKKNGVETRTKSTPSCRISIPQP